MLHVSMVGDAYAEVDATIITIDGPSLLCWAGDGTAHARGAVPSPVLNAEPVARYGLDQVLSIRLVETAGRDGDPARAPGPRNDPAHPNAFRRWTAEEQDAVVAGFHRGDTLAQLAAATGRRVGGVRARLISLGVIQPEPGDRLRFPGTPAVAAVIADATDDGAGGRGAGGVRRPRPLLRAVTTPRTPAPAGSGEDDGRGTRGAGAGT